MDYIYKDELNNKYVGTIESMDIIPYYEFTIKINEKDETCHMEYLSYEWVIHFIDLDKHVELAHPTDVFWNAEALYSIFDDEHLCWRIAFAIKTIYEYYTKKIS